MRSLILACGKSEVQAGEITTKGTGKYVGIHIYLHIYLYSLCSDNVGHIKIERPRNLLSPELNVTEVKKS